MSEEKEKAPAFPCGRQIHDDPGMDLRDWFAGMALQGYCSNTHAWEEKDIYQQVSMSYEAADIMMKEREK